GKGRVNPAQGIVKGAHPLDFNPKPATCAVALGIFGGGTPPKIRSFRVFLAVMRSITRKTCNPEK
ncbi:MAG: hypothetical protein LBN04_01955, partial [Oscillospiraceae bacterium]|nr:hypothetical protein [Oscillospiraceae bacterium]